MLRDIDEKVRVQLIQEKKSREEVEDHLLSLLEEASVKLNTAANF